LTATNVTDTSVSISWDAVEYPAGIKEYEIYRDGVKVGTRVGTTFTESGLDASTTYKYQVKAIGNNNLESSLSDELTVTTTGGE